MRLHRLLFRNASLSQVDALLERGPCIICHAAIFATLLENRCCEKATFVVTTSTFAMATTIGILIASCKSPPNFRKPVYIILLKYVVNLLSPASFFF